MAIITITSQSSLLDFFLLAYLPIPLLLFACLYTHTDWIKITTLALASFLSIIVFALTLVIGIGCLDAGQSCLDSQTLHFLLFRITLVLSPILVAIAASNSQKKYA